MQLPNGSGWPWIWTKKENQDWEIGGYHTAQVGPGDRGIKKKELVRFGFDLDLIWIEIGVSKIKFFKE